MKQNLNPYRRIAGQADRARLLVGTRDQRIVLEDDLARLDVASGDSISEIAYNINQMRLTGFLNPE